MNVQISNEQLRKLEEAFSDTISSTIAATLTNHPHVLPYARRMVEDIERRLKRSSSMLLNEFFGEEQDV